MTTRAQARTIAASLLREHFDTEASDAGLRSLDLASTGARGASSYDASAVARADRAKARRMFGDANSHRRVREALKRLSSKHAEIITLAYGDRLRSRDVEDSKKRKALPQAERNWRVRLVELYGPEAGMVLASPLANKLYAKHLEHLETSASDALPPLDERVDAGRNIDGPFMPYDDTDEDKARLRVMIPKSTQHVTHEVAGWKARGLVGWLLWIDNDQVTRIEADSRRCLNEALDAFAEAYGVAPTEHAPARRRSSERTRTRILASHAEHGHEIGG